MQYLIRHKENKMYYSKKIDNTHNHYAEDKEDAYIFKNKWEANRKLKELGNNFEIIISSFLI